MPNRNAKVLLVGWDAADWKMIHPLLDQGLMPTLNQFIDRGVMGNLASLQPMLSPMLWNSIATGVRPEKHGIHGFIEPDPQTSGVRPVTSTSRKVKAIWNILTQEGFKAHTVGWFASHPAEPISGVSVSDQYPHATAPLGQPWPLPEGAVHPERLRETFARLRMHPAEVPEGAILPIIPKAASIDQEKDKRLMSFAKVLAENCSIHNCATWILEHKPWDFAAVYYNGIDHFGHAFMDFHPPRREGVPENMFDLYQGVMNGAYRFHDMLLDRLIQLAPPETTVLLVSDHGFHSDHLRPHAIPKEPAGPTVQHRPMGIFVMAGPGVRHDERIYGATLLDVTPTILSVFGLPVGRDMDGRVLVQAFKEPPAIESIASWEAVPGDCGMHAADLRMDPISTKAVIDQFVALGYVQQEENQQKAVASAVRELQFNRARALMDARNPSGAMTILSQLDAEWPNVARFRQNLALCYLELGRLPEAKAILLDLLDNPPQDPTYPPGRTGVDAAAQEIAGVTPPDAVQTPAVPDGVRSSVREARRDWMMGIILHEEGDREGSLECLLRAEQADPQLPNLHILLGGTYLAMGRVADAKRAYLRALETDGDSPEAHLGLARVYLRERKNKRAAKNALIAVGLQHYMPVGHFVLGLALGRLRYFNRAIQALETSVLMVPGFLNAHRCLAAIHGRPEGNKSKAAHHREVALQLSQERERKKRARP
jgi:tetratricopeptide (TPR) repeat protein